MDPLTMKLILLDHCRGIGRKSILALTKWDPQLSCLDQMNGRELAHALQLTGKKAEYFIRDYSSINAEKVVDEYSRKGIFPVSFQSTLYPNNLKNVIDPPVILYVKGDIARLGDHKMLSVVGTRHPTDDAEQIMQQLLLPLIETGWTIVSGLALGVDAMAHRLAINGRTIAVLGSGHYFPYPLRHRHLFDTLSEHQLVISEYPPSSRPERWRFPERNRIISGLSLGTLVIQARERSGSLITADQALEQGREVFAVPGSVLNDNSAGTNRLIQQGAKLVLDCHDILDELGNYE